MNVHKAYEKKNLLSWWVVTKFIHPNEKKYIVKYITTLLNTKIRTLKSKKRIFCVLELVPLHKYIEFVFDEKFKQKTEKATY